MADRTHLRQVTMLLHPFPDKHIKKNPSGGGEYVAHPLVEQRIIDVLGRPPDTSVVQVIRGYVAAIPPNPDGNSKRARDGAPAIEDAICGCVLRMTATIDGQAVTVEEAGDCEDPHNWKTDGARLKDATSDAYKRAAMRLGVALHLWCKDGAFYLGQKFLDADNEAATKPAEVAS